MVTGAVDEIKQYLDARYIGAPEAIWRLLSFQLHEESPNVVRLAVHLPNQQWVVFNSQNSAQSIQNTANKKKTTLMAYFEFYEMNQDFPAYPYQEFPQHCRWLDDRWVVRKRGFAIGRMYFVDPNAGELFYLRLLLTIVPGARSFDHLKTTFNEGVEVLHPTFKSACIALGLLENDGEWNICLQEAKDIKVGYQLRSLFVIILTRCSPTQPEVLWERFGPYICDDLPHTLKTHYGVVNPSQEQVLDYGLFLLNKLLEDNGKTLKDFKTMPQPKENWERIVGNRLIWEHRLMQYDIDESVAEQNVQKLNCQQRESYDEMIGSVMRNEGKSFFLNGSAGTGKTFLYNTLAASCRLKGNVVLAVASSGVASLLLTGGRTAHSTFKIPFNIQETSVCNVQKKSNEGDLFRAAKLIIWDEVPMQHRYCVEAVDRCLRDIRSDGRPFGGITIVLGGDFRQTLPVIEKGRREQIVGASLRSSPLWENITVLKLTQNMRLGSTHADNVQFAEFLLQVGTDPKEKVELPSSIHKCSDINNLISEIYPGIGDKILPEEKYLTDRTILSPRNEDVASINASILQMCRGNEHTYLAADKEAENKENRATGLSGWPSESLNAMNPSCLPPFKLDLKIGSPIMMLRNINPREGLCNGTRLRVEMCLPHVIRATILTGDKQGQMVFIPRISLTPTS